MANLKRFLGWDSLLKICQILFYQCCAPFCTVHIISSSSPNEEQRATLARAANFQPGNVSFGINFAGLPLNSDIIIIILCQLLYWIQVPQLEEMARIYYELRCIFKHLSSSVKRQSRVLNWNICWGMEHHQFWLISGIQKSTDALRV